MQLGGGTGGRPPDAASAGGRRTTRWHHCDGGVTSARGANSGSAEALAPAVAVICGGGPITRVERARRRPPSLVDAVLAAVGV